MEKASMEKTTEAGERTKIAEETVVVRSVVEDVLIADIPDTPVKGIKDEGDVLVMVGAEIIDTPNELSKKPKEGSGLVSIPTILEEELQQLLAQNSTAEEKVAVKKDPNMDDEAVLALKVEGVEDNELKTEKNAGPEGEKKEKKEKSEKGEDKKKNTEKDEKRKEKKEKKDKKEKDEKKKEKKEKKSKKSDVERIRKKLEKIHAKIDRIHAKKQEYLQRLAEAEEKERQERERHAAEAAAKQKQDLASTAKFSSERNGDALSGEAREDEEAVEAAVKHVEPSEKSSAKLLEEKISAPDSSSNTGTTEKEVSKQPTGVTDDLVLDQSSARG